MNYKNFFTYYKAIIVSIIASVTDISLMFSLSTTTLSEHMVLGISSVAGLLIQFFGQKLTDFKVEEEADGRYRLWARCKNAPHKEPYFTVRYFNPLNNELENE